MIFLVLGAAVFLVWAWARSAAMRRGGWRVGAGLLAAALITAGAVIAIKGDAWVGLPMVLVGLASAAGGRINRGAWRWDFGPWSPNGPARSASPPPPPRDGMSASEARSILGVGPEAGEAEIRAAYSRLMQRAHPDKGGTAGLAAQLNAARDRLLKRR